MVRVGVVGLGKMGLSHLAMIRVHPGVELAAVCDASAYLLGVLGRHTGVRTFRDYKEMLASGALDAVVIATPSRLHAGMVQDALERGLHVFCEKPFVLEPDEGRRLAALAAERGLVNQVGYHYRFVAAFEEAKRLLDAGAIGEVTHALAEAYGPVVLRPKGSTWRTQRTEGGGCLYDYAAHPINLLNWFFGAPEAVSGTAINGVFSSETDDEVYSTLHFDRGRTAQVSVNWADESCRKMTTKLTLWGTGGRIFADRQEIQVYLRGTVPLPAGYTKGWNVRYTTELTQQTWFYLRGEEYSHQIDDFVRRIEAGAGPGRNSFASAVATDDTLAAMLADSRQGARVSASEPKPAAARTKPGWLPGWLLPSGAQKI